MWGIRGKDISEAVEGWAAEQSLHGCIDVAPIVLVDQTTGLQAHRSVVCRVLLQQGCGKMMVKLTTLSHNNRLYLTTTISIE